LKESLNPRKSGRFKKSAYDYKDFPAIDQCFFMQRPAKHTVGRKADSLNFKHQQKNMAENQPLDGQLSAVIKNQETLPAST